MSSRSFSAVFIAVLAFAATAQAAPTRPLITGISHLGVYTSNPSATDHYYREVLGFAKESDPENPLGVRYMVNAIQYIEVLPLPPNAGIVRLDHTAWNVSNAEEMLKYLSAKGWKTPARVRKGSDGSRWFAVHDPEGNKVEFVQPPADAKAPDEPNAIGHKIIHMGFMVHSRAKEDTFYRDLLDFKPYWYGGMVPGKIDWVSQQVPDGHEWLEYMLTSGPSGSGIPAHISQHQLGVLDHFSIGEVSVNDAFAILKKDDRMAGIKNDGHTQIGKDGKGQFNLYDPDGIRAELMNFHATEKPCCSPFTAADPSE